jgi:hypothetical protein
MARSATRVFKGVPEMTTLWGPGEGDNSFVHAVVGHLVSGKYLLQRAGQAFTVSIILSALRMTSQDVVKMLDVKRDMDGAQ